MQKHLRSLSPRMARRPLRGYVLWTITLAMAGYFATAPFGVMTGPVAMVVIAVMVPVNFWATKW